MDMKTRQGQDLLLKFYYNCGFMQAIDSKAQLFAFEKVRVDLVFLIRAMLEF